MPEVAGWLRTRGEAEVSSLERGEAVEGMPARLQEIFHSAARWGQVATLRGLPESGDADPRPPRRIPGAKLGQVRALAAVAATVVHEVHAGRILDWCSGKGHLGREVARRTDRPLTLLEREAALCAAGATLAADEDVNCETFHVDVMQGPTQARLGGDDAVVALDACGALSERLVEEAIAQRPAAVVAAGVSGDRGNGRRSGRALETIT